jgi:hypothetical protein
MTRLERWRYKLRSLAQVAESLQTLASLTVDLREQLRGHQIQLDTLYSQLREQPTRYATVMLLWTEGFASVTLALMGGHVSGELRCVVPVPPGAWLVAVGCHLGSVVVGHDLQDIAMPDRSPMVRLSASVPLGVLVRFRVVPLAWVP